MADKLVSMKLTKADQDKNSPLATNGEPDAPRYPYGLELHLDNDVIDKLDMPLPKVGGELTLIAKVKVTSVSSHENVGQKIRSSVSLQITKMCLEPPGEQAADKLYPGQG